MTTSLNLFDPRGGSLCAHVCEVCNEPLEDDAVLSTCAECNENEEEE
jgi:hypothetical protein